MERRRVAAHGPNAQANDIPTKGSGRVIGAIVVAAFLGFAYGFAPAVIEAVFGESEAHDVVISEEAVIAILLYVLGIILVPLVSAGVIGASRGSWRRSGLAVLIVTVAATITLGWSIGAGSAEGVRYKGFLDKGWLAIFAAAGLVFVSFGGLTKVTSIAEEVQNPGRNLPLGMLLAWGVVSFFT